LILDLGDPFSSAILMPGSGLRAGSGMISENGKPAGSGDDP